MEIFPNLWHGSYEEAFNTMFLEERKITHVVCCDTSTHHTIHKLLKFDYKILIYSLKKNSVDTLLAYCVVYKGMSFIVAYYFLKPRISLEHPSAYTSVSSLTPGDTGATAQ
jgi:hypothetical protein